MRPITDGICPESRLPCKDLMHTTTWKSLLTSMAMPKSMRMTTKRAKILQLEIDKRHVQGSNLEKSNVEWNLATKIVVGQIPDTHRRNFIVKLMSKVWSDSFVQGWGTYRTWKPVQLPILSGIEPLKLLFLTSLHTSVWIQTLTTEDA